MRLSRRASMLLRAGVGVTLAFIYIPLAVIALYAFDSSNILEWPPPGLTTHWFGEAFKDPTLGNAVVMSLKAGVAATAIALVLGTLASLAVARHRFFGRETISFLVVLPIALP
ncbi:MAG: putative spermidine/putrescine transport system permease protein, partial [Pseudonocardiales bacterium]|nr:putative spermidine/putrescine transport system permease protein [Pseudonocardiales bacterium]